MHSPFSSGIQTELGKKIMEQSILSKVKEHYGDIEVAECCRIGRGHINETYLLSGNGKYTFQKINTAVFRNVEGVMDNIVKVTSHIAKKAFTVRPLSTLDGKFYFTDNDGTFRLMTYAEGTVKEKITSADDMETVGKGFGRFQSYLSDFHDTLVETIKNFHNTPVRYGNLIKSAERESERRTRSAELLEEFIKLRDLSYIIMRPLAENKIPVRVTHNDTKINNLVIKDGEPVCAIDLDTVMQGSLCFDFGDCVRSGGTRSFEDDPIEVAKLDLEFFEAFCKGFFCGLEITEREKRLLTLSPAVLAYECGMRFLTDYLDGDLYFGAKFPEQNFLRAQNQLALAKDFLSNADGMERIIDGFFY